MIQKCKMVKNQKIQNGSLKHFDLSLIGFSFCLFCKEKWSGLCLVTYGPVVAIARRGQGEREDRQ